MLSSLVSKLKLSTAAKAWLGLLAVAAQVALSYVPEHGNLWYNATQGLVGLLSILGIYAVPNKVAAVEAAVKDVQTVVTDVAADMQGGPVAIPVPNPAAPVTEPSPIPPTTTGA